MDGEQADGPTCQITGAARKGQPPVTHWDDLRVIPVMQRPFLVASTAVLCLTFAGGCAGEPLSPRAERAQAERAVAAWVAANPDGWAGASRTDAVAARPGWTPACDDPASNGYVSLRLATAGGDIELAFRCPLDDRASAADLQDHFVRAVPWNLPTGIRSPNWRFQAVLPVSSIYDGVTFHTPSPGLLAVDINSTMLGVQGVSTRESCAAPAHAGSDACQFIRAHRVPLRMRFTLPADLGALR